MNPVSKLDTYPIPKIQDIFATLEKGQTFRKVDLSRAYQQLLLEEESKKYVVIKAPHDTRGGIEPYGRKKRSAGPNEEMQS